MPMAIIRSIIVISSLILVLLIITTKNGLSQDFTNDLSYNSDSKWFISLNLGTQISGIKKEDFVRSNFSPLIDIRVGRWFVSYLGLNVGYKGKYFQYIDDNVKHSYDFFYGEAFLDLIRLFIPRNGSWSVILHAGAGYFYNQFYGRPNICANVGLKQKIAIARKWNFLFDVSAIMGWDIYQNNEDILPGATLGLTYCF